MSKSFFYTVLVYSISIQFTQSYSVPLTGCEGFNQLIPGLYESGKPINITDVAKNHLECDCITGSIVGGVREAILYSFVLISPPGQKRFQEQKLKLSKRENESVLSYIKVF